MICDHLKWLAVTELWSGVGWWYGFRVEFIVVLYYPVQYPKDDKFVKIYHGNTVGLLMKKLVYMVTTHWYNFIYRFPLVLYIFQLSGAISCHFSYLTQIASAKELYLSKHPWGESGTHQKISMIMVQTASNSSHCHSLLRPQTTHPIKMLCAYIATKSALTSVVLRSVADTIPAYLKVGQTSYPHIILWHTESFRSSPISFIESDIIMHLCTY